MPHIELDWEVWALPLSVAWTCDIVIIRLGPLCMSWGGQEFDSKLRRVEDTLRKVG